MALQYVDKSSFSEQTRNLTHISLKDVAIEFPIYDSERNLRQNLLGKTVGGLFQKNNKERPYVRALNNISLQIAEGDRVGLVGHNGSGKTTLLQTIAGIFAPVRGEITVEGKVSALFTTNLGIDNDDTGYRNIVTCGLALGMTLDEITQKKGSIAEFSALGEYLSLPVHCYSAGMAMRLAFAIATAIEPEILLLDEGIMAGDASFHAKAQKRITSLMNRTRVLVLASHSAELLQEWCNKAVLLEHGEVVATGTVGDIIHIYQDRVRAMSNAS